MEKKGEKKKEEKFRKKEEKRTLRLREVSGWREKGGGRGSSRNTPFVTRGKKRGGEA